MDEIRLSTEQVQEFINGVVKIVEDILKPINIYSENSANIATTFQKQIQDLEDKNKINHDAKLKRIEELDKLIKSGIEELAETNTQLEIGRKEGYAELNRQLDRSNSRFLGQLYPLEHYGGQIRRGGEVVAFEKPHYEKREDVCHWSENYDWA